MRKAGFNVQLADPNLPCRGESLLPNAPLGDFDVDPVVRAKQEVFARLPNFEQGPAQGPNTPIKYYPGMGYAPEKA